MNKDLLPYYERELIFVRKVAAEFAEQYPERASALRLGERGSDDPHVERILQAFALIAGRIQHRLDDEFPEMTHALLELLYPHLLRPVPPMTTLQFMVDPLLSKERTGHTVARGTLAFSAPMDGVQCRFRTVYDTQLWPIEVSAARFGNVSDVAAGVAAGDGARHALRLEFQLLGGSRLADLDLRDLWLRIAGDQQAAHWLYEALFSRVRRVVLRPVHAGTTAAAERSVSLPPDCLRQVGFARDEALLPVAETSFQGYRLMQEYFCYPQKFLYFELSGLDAAPRDATANRLEAVILFDPLEQADRALLLESAVNAGMFQLGCTPAINLFRHSAEPIRLSHTRTRYPVVPDIYAPLGYEVYSVDRVVAESPNLQSPKEYRPFYSFLHGAAARTDDAGEGSRSEAEAFWFATRAASTRGAGLESDVFLSFVDHGFRMSDAAAESVTVNVTCSNRDLAARLRSNLWGELDLETDAMVKTRLVDAPTRTIRPERRGAMQWRLISHLSLNHLSLVEGGVDALRELLRLYDPLTSRSSARQIEGLTAIRSSRKVARMSSEHGFVFCPGIAIEAEMDEDKFSGGGAFLLANILERFFGLYCSVNSFTQLRVSTRQREGVVWQWPIRSGEQAVA